MESDTDPSYKALFLGPKSENEKWVRQEFQSILDYWFNWRKSLFLLDRSPISDKEIKDPRYLKIRSRLSKALETLNELLKAETPKYTPRYVGHMVSELSLPAILGHFATLLHNPNNTSKEASRVGARIEQEAIGMLSRMIGYDPSLSKGHFTSGGTVANFEAVWRARFRYDHWVSLALYLAEKHGRKFNLFDAGGMGWERFKQLRSEFHVPELELRKFSSVIGNPHKISRLISKQIGADYLGPVVFVPDSKHFSWQKAVNVFGLGEESFWPIPLDHHGKMNSREICPLLKKAKRENRPVLLIVSIAGTTETGEIDPISETQAILDGLRSKESIDIWHHIDAAYGGFMCSLIHQKIFDPQRLKIVESLKAISRAHSVTLDPHKLGYVPYSCGAFLVREKDFYSVSSFKAPYIDRPEFGRGMWSSTLEGSRTAAGASATWLTGKSIGFTSETFAKIIDSTFNSCQEFRKNLEKHLPWICPLNPTETNILCFSVAEKNDSLETSNRKTSLLFDMLSKSPNFSVSKTTLGADNYGLQIKEHLKYFGGESDSNHLVLIRCVFMNPFWNVKSVQDQLIPEFIDELKSLYENLE